MGTLLEKFKGLVDPSTLDAIRKLSDELQGNSILHVYSARLRGDARAMLDRLSEYFSDLGLQYRANTVVGTEDLFDLVRHSEEGAASGPGSAVSERWVTAYREAISQNAQRMFLSSDLVVIHGIQPIGLIDHRSDDSPWLWCCHVNLAGTPPPFWSFMGRFAARYQGVLFSHASYVPGPEFQPFVVPPSIDPFAPVNRGMNAGEVARILGRMGIPANRPLALQYLAGGSTSEALDAIRVWKAGRSPRKAVLVLLRVGQGASDKECASASELAALKSLDPRVHVVQLERESSSELAALGWAAQVAIDASAARWPNLDLFDAMWKGVPVIVHSQSANAAFVGEGAGFSVGSQEELARRLGDLLEDPRSAREMGAAGHAEVQGRHLVPRHLLDYLKLMLYFGRDSA